MNFLKASALALATLAPLGAMAPLPALADSAAGDYLAGRQARATDDFDNAAYYYRRAMQSLPDDPRVLEGLVQSEVSVGRFADAIPAAQRLEDLGGESQLARMVLVVDALKHEDYDGLLTRISAQEGAGPLADGLLTAWIRLGQGNMDAALAAFDKVASEDGLAYFARYHKALALAYVGDFAAAEAIYADPEGGQLEMTRRGALARIEALSQLDRDEEALTLLRSLFGSDLNPELQQIKARLDAGETLDNTHVTSITDGAAEVFYSIAAALQSEASPQYTLLFTRLASALRPDHVDAQLLAGQLLESLDQPELATAAYRSVSRDDPNFYLAELGRADTLFQSERDDAALEVLNSLAVTYPDLSEVQAALGSMQRRLGNHRAAVEAYSRALDLRTPDDRGNWLLLYNRAMSRERLNDWPGAEADFRAALDRNPNQPNVLNYFGYSLVEQNENLDEALEMIERAVDLSPDSGYIVDSLGWVLFQLGRVQEAVPQMERAAELMPVDSVVNDHLGDVYWSVGRKLEAQFQWTRALSLDPEDDEADRIRRKLKVGLDAVLADEKAVSGQVASDDG
ncbi:tetratricopeptide repeat protein [Pseudooceanicola algae]|uniref:Beta-barrel assembly-enhancing protease n=1 Tax=Pseudooceanicola algae TaxID=1537215 RepID=A0A418SKG0_9RHOB|nr:tetratricopeptide repeat protein [Pseudooceanicola algae]QPM90702.1 Beta-barrel assembly-enhancing protease [Pseudooceanicola algae]